MSDQQKIDLRQQFLDILIDLKTTHGVQQARIAEMLHVSPSHISRIKKGDSPSAHLLLALRSINKEHFSKADGSETHLREPTVQYAAPMDKILGRAVSKMAIELAESLEFASVDEYLRYLIRAEHAARFDGGKAPGIEPSGGAGAREKE